MSETVELRRRLATQDILIEYTRRFASTLDLSLIRTTLAEVVVQTTGAKQCGIVMLDTLLHCWSYSPGDGLREREIKAAPGRTLREVFAIRAPLIWCADPGTADDPPRPFIENELVITSYMAIPLFYDRQVIGVVEAFNLAAPENSVQQAELLADIAISAGLALHNGILYECATRQLSERQDEERSVKILVTELGRANKRLQEQMDRHKAGLDVAAEQLDDLQYVKGILAVYATDELQSTLESIRLHLEYHRTVSECGETLDPIYRDVSRLKCTAARLLDLADVEGKEERRQLTDLNRLVGQFVEDRVLLSARYGQSLCWEPSPDLPDTLVNRSDIERVLNILYVNATTSTSPLGDVVVRTFSANDMVGFSVIDSGPGIPLDEQEYIFDRYFRGSTGQLSGVSGTGLGLVLAKEIVERHDGRIELKSEGKPGEGATFTVWLPVLMV